MSEVKPNKGPWYRDDSMIEHSCCWDAAIVADVPKGHGMYGGTKALVAECDNWNAPLIISAHDLLAEVKHMRNDLINLKAFSTSDATRHALSTMIARVEKVIAKAEPQQ